MESPIPQLKSYLQEQQLINADATLLLRLTDHQKEKACISNLGTNTVKAHTFTETVHPKIYRKLQPFQKIVDDFIFSTYVKSYQIDFYENKILTTFDLALETIESTINQLLETYIITEPLTKFKFWSKKDQITLRTHTRRSTNRYLLSRTTKTVSETLFTLFRNLLQWEHSNPKHLTHNITSFRFNSTNSKQSEITVVTETKYSDLHIDLTPFYENLP